VRAEGIASRLLGKARSAHRPSFKQFSNVHVNHLPPHDI
jgi:hypothetical protein